MPCRSIASFTFALLALAPSAPTQVAQHTCRGGGKIALDVDYGYSFATFSYQLSDPKLFSAAWLEVWDRPQRLSRKQVPVQKQGKLTWRPKDDPPETPSELLIAVVDPSRSSDLSEVLIAGIREDREGSPTPSFPSQSFVLEEGGASADLTIQGAILSPVTHLSLSEKEASGIWIAREDLSGTLADLQHMMVQIPPGYLSRPTVLKLGSSVTVYVMSKDRPVLSSIDPTAMSADSAAAGINVRLLGSGFGPESRVVTVFADNIHDLSTKTIFVSSSELQVSVDPAYSGVSSDSTRTEGIQFWVSNGDDLHVSDPQELRILPTEKHPLRSRPVPSIISTSPYPVPLMDSGSPAFLPLTVYGDNFREDQYVILRNDEVAGVRLKTEYVSPQELHVLLPREFWQHHRYSYRLVAQTSKGVCATELWEDDDDGAQF